MRCITKWFRRKPKTTEQVLAARVRAAADAYNEAVRDARKANLKVWARMSSDDGYGSNPDVYDYIFNKVSITRTHFSEY